MSLIEVAVRHRLGDFTLDLAFESDGKLTALFGRSGAGKTSIINLIGGLIGPDQGKVSIDGETLLDTERGIFIAPHQRRIGYVFQEGRLFPHLSVRQNLLYGRWFARRRKAVVEYAHVVALLGLEALVERRTDALSGGEKQRVAIGRALLSNPRLLLLDEPFASLDEARRAAILPYIERLRDEVGIPMVYVSHSIAEVARLASSVVLIADGRVLAVGAPADVLGRRASLMATGPGEAISLLQARVAHHDEAFGLTVLATTAGSITVPRIAAAPASEVRVVVHASDVMLSTQMLAGISALNILSGTVAEMAEEDGAIVDVGLDCGGQRLLVRITRKSAAALELAIGRPLYAVIKSVALHDRD